MCIIKILTSDAFPLFMKFWGTLDPPPLTIHDLVHESVHCGMLPCNKSGVLYL